MNNDPKFFSKTFWSGTSASLKLEEGMSSRLKFRYYVIGAFFTAFLFESLYWMGVFTVEPTNTYDVLISLSSIAIAVYGTLYIYKKHKSSVSFIEKMIIIGVASAPKLFLIIGLPAVAITLIADKIVYGSILEYTTFVELLATVIAQAFYYYLLSKYFVSKNETPTTL